MPYPAGLTLIPVAGSVTSTPAETAEVLFRCPQWLTDLDDNQIIAPFTIPALIAGDGTFTVNLPACDDPQISPTGWSYDVTLRYGNRTARGSLTVPIGTVGTLELGPALVLNQPAAPGTPTTPGSGGGTVLWSAIVGKPATFPPAEHSHTIAIAGVTGLVAALAGKQPTGSYAAAADLTALAGRVDAVEDLAAAAAPAGHTHPLAGVDGLVAALAGKQPTGSYAAAADLTALAGRVTTVENAAGSYATAAALTTLAGRVTAVEDMTPALVVWNGTAYVDAAAAARVYVGPTDPGAAADGSVWIDTTP